MRVVKAYRAERREALVFSKGVHRLFRNVAKTMTGFSAVTAFSTLLFGAISVSILWVGSNDVLAGRMTMGALFQFTALLAMLVGPVVQIVSIGSQITEAFAGLERIREIRNELTEDSGDDTRSSLSPIEGTVEFRDVTFEYQPGVPVLHGISFTAKPGTSTALVGPSGSGKSTLIGLVAACAGLEQVLGLAFSHGKLYALESSTTPGGRSATCDWSRPASVASPSPSTASRQAPRPT